MSTRPSGGREVAQRVFATEFSGSTYTFTRGEDDRAPKYVVSPTGALMNRVFVVGVLTDVDQVNEETIRARIADYTGVFVVYASQYQPDARASLQDMSPPGFVAITGKANTFTPDGRDRAFTSIRPEAIAAVDAETRDYWTVTTAEHTFARLGQLAAAQQTGDTSNEGIRMAIEEYAPTHGYTSALYKTCLEVLEVVAGERDTVETIPDLSESEEATIPLSDIITTGERTGLEPESILDPTPVKVSSDSEPSTREPEESADEESDTEPPDLSIDPDEPVVSADEREAIETEFGTDFATGDEIEPPDEAPSTGEVISDSSDELASPTAEDLSSTDNDDADEPLDAQMMGLLRELDAGEGVDRTDLVDAGRDRFNFDEDTIEEAIRTAMMDGECYEPAEDVLRPI